jgi:hypothetical protein
MAHGTHSEALARQYSAVVLVKLEDTLYAIVLDL